jgi:hypothetical protein
MNFVSRTGHLFLPLLAALFAAGILPLKALAAEPSRTMSDRIRTLIPELEAYIGGGMKSFDVPGLAIGIVTDDKLIYAKGFGTRSKGGEPVDTKTIFQIGSTTKAFLAATSPLPWTRASLNGMIVSSTSIPIFSSRTLGSRASSACSISSRSVRGFRRTSMTDWGCSVLMRRA